MFGSVKQTIEADLANGIFNTPEWEETLTHFPKGNRNVAAEIACVVDRRREEGSNELDGDGRTPDSGQGRRIRRTYTVDVPNSVTLDKRDTFVIDNQLWSMIRIIGRDASPSGSQSFVCVRIDKDFTRQSTMRPTANWRARSKQ